MNIWLWLTGIDYQKWNIRCHSYKELQENYILPVCHLQLCPLLKDGKRFWSEEHKVPHAVVKDQWFGYDDAESIRHKVSSWWRHDVVTWKHVPHYWPFVRGIHRSSVDSLTKRQLCIVFIFPLLLSWTIIKTASRVAGDLRRHDAYVTSLYVCTAGGMAVGGRLWRLDGLVPGHRWLQGHLLQQGQVPAAPRTQPGTPGPLSRASAGLRGHAPSTR